MRQHHALALATLAVPNDNGSSMRARALRGRLAPSTPWACHAMLSVRAARSVLRSWVKQCGTRLEIRKGIQGAVHLPSTEFAHREGFRPAQHPRPALCTHAATSWYSLQSDCRTQQHRRWRTRGPGCSQFAGNLHTGPARLCTDGLDAMRRRRRRLCRLCHDDLATEGCCAWPRGRGSARGSGIGLTREHEARHR